MEKEDRRNIECVRMKREKRKKGWWENEEKEKCEKDYDEKRREWMNEEREERKKERERRKKN